MEERERIIKFVRNRRDEDKQLGDRHRYRTCQCRKTPGGARTVTCRRLAKAFEFKVEVYNEVLKELERFGQDPDFAVGGSHDGKV